MAAEYMCAFCVAARDHSPVAGVVKRHLGAPWKKRVGPNFGHISELHHPGDV